MILLIGIVLIILAFNGVGQNLGPIGVTVAAVGFIIELFKHDNKEAEARANRREYWANKNARRR